MELVLEIEGEEEKGNWIEIHNKDLCDLHCIWDIKCRVMRRAGRACGKNERQQNCTQNFVASHNGTRPPGRARRRHLISSNTGVRRRGESVEGHAKLAVARQNDNILGVTKYDRRLASAGCLTFSSLSPLFQRRRQFLTLCSVADRRMNEYEHWRYDTDRGKLRYSEIRRSQWLSVYHTD